MIVVDTTVWVDFFRGRELPHVRVPILHNDADFDRLAAATALQVHQPRAPA